MPYANFRYIAYTCPTVSLEGPIANPMPKAVYRIPPGNVTNPPPLRGAVDKLGADARTRIERMIGVLEQARQWVIHPAQGDNGTTLKIFMLPEFYFRPDNKEQSYTIDEFRAIKDVLYRTITAEGTNNHYNHWLIICGTIMWRRSFKNVEKDTQDTAYYNTCVYVKGRWNRGKVTKGVIEKTQASSIDGIPTGRHNGGFAIDDSKHSASEAFKMHYDLSYLKKHLFKIGTIDCGLEICLEHAMFSAKKLTPKKQLVKNDFVHNTASMACYGVLKKLLNEVRNTNIKLQFLTAGGMPIEQTGVAANSNGFIMRNDGYSLGDTALHSELVGNYYKLDLNNIPNQPKLKFTNYNPNSVDFIGRRSSVKWALEMPLATTNKRNYYGVPNLTIDTSANVDNLAGTNLEIPRPTKANAGVWNSQRQQIVYFNSRLIP